MNILVTGGAGFIGSHTLIELYKAGHTAVVVDNLSNSNPVALQRVESILNDEVRNSNVGHTPQSLRDSSPNLGEQLEIPFYKVDIQDREGLERVFEEHQFDACIHFAGLKAVGESVEKPWEYYENNIGGTLTLVDVMRKHGCKNIIFSSSATVYGDPVEIPITENCPKGQCTNPYGWTKSMLEQVLMDIQKADPEWNVVLLRYFNPVGAHKSGRIGENPNGIPNNLMPYITQVAVGKRKELGVFGNDYPTPDGTGVRDYIHVVDLANAHVAALKCFANNFEFRNSKSEIQNSTFIYNVGTGHGYSVLDMVKAFVRVNGVEVPYSIKPRRAGDIATCYCNPAKAKKELGWEARYGVDDMVRDSWNWQRQNPEGYQEL
ncbi:MAG: UDP-glucose 4-epimerase GalE [Bacteroidales bacterium]|nr:UDP-glucose 4-epimerase GalE [Bacteroidales bacterium]